jgi:hypothetical protein
MNAILDKRLADEILQAQRARSDLFKWKLLLVAALGAVGLGLGRPNLSPAPLILCLIPLVCVYVDLICSHLWIQIHVIGEYLRKRDEAVAERRGNLLRYEEFVKKVTQMPRPESRPTPPRGRLNAFAFEKAVLYFSTIILSVGVAAAGSAIVHGRPSCDYVVPQALPYWLAGAAGILLTFIIKRAYDARFERLENLGIDRDSDPELPGAN